MDKSFFHFSVTLTWSKIMALVIVVLSFTMDFMADKGGTVFMYSLPFAIFLITGKQVLDARKSK